mgnify:CR=1 FL=1
MGLFRRNEELVYRQQGLERFVEAQKRDYKIALEEVRSGQKRTHWIWYIFPQMYGLGHSCYANLYGIRDRKEAEEYLKDKTLGKRLREITSTLLQHEGKSAEEIFGELDAMKVRSSMTLFDAVCPNDMFAEVLEKFYNGERCGITIAKLNEI